MEFICLVDPEMPAYVRGDPGRIRQILLNLTGNSLKFTSSGEVTIYASVDSQTETEAVLRFIVADTGIGIAPDKLDALFEPFVQADASVTRRFGGTGLGLAISKQLAEMMGGEIGAQSTEGLGSTFWFTVRVEKRAAPPEEARGLPLQIAGERILVVDDNRTNRRLLSVLLDSWGCEHDEAPDGIVALHKLRTAVARGIAVPPGHPGHDDAGHGRRDAWAADQGRSRAGGDRASHDDLGGTPPGRPRTRGAHRFRGTAGEACEAVPTI